MSDLSSEERAYEWLSQNLDLDDKVGKLIFSQWTSMLRQSFNLRNGIGKAPKVLLYYQIVFWREASSVSFSMRATTAVSLPSQVQSLKEVGIRCVFQGAVPE